MPTELIIGLVIVAVLVGGVLFARSKTRSGSGSNDASGGGGRPGADKH